MRKPYQKSLAVLMVGITLISLLLSVFFLIEIWRFRQPATLKLQTSLKETSAVLQTTRESLEVMDQVISTVYSSTLYLDDTTNALARTLQSTDSFIDSAGTFVGKDLINTITNTQHTLDSAQASAQVIDNIMSALSRVPLIGIDYNPSQPLSTALGRVSASLDPFEGSLKDFRTNLESTRMNLQSFSEQLDSLDQNIKTINRNLDSSRKVIERYRSQVTDMQSWMDQAQISLPNWVTTTCWILTIIIIWLILIQVAILIQGVTRLTSIPITSE